MSNKKTVIIKISIVICMILITLLAFIPINKNYKPVTWMKNINDNTLITEMAIPGSHDSGATRSLFDVSGKCQDLDISKQLNIGVRFLDIRLKLLNNELVVVHSFVDQKLKFNKVLDDINDFITKNKSEFLIISIKEDDSPKNSNIDFDETVISQLSKYKTIVFDNTLPKTLKEARGKVYILNRFTNEEIGIHAYSGWHDSTSFELNNLYVQDNYCINDFETKKNDILNTFNYSNINNDKLILNFTSCYLDNAFPPTYAGSIAKNINNWLLEYIPNDNDNISGIIIMDFVTEKLVRQIYMENNYEKNN